MTAVYVIGSGLLLAGILLFSYWFIRGERKAGEDRQARRQAEGTIDNVAKGNEAAARLDRDPEYAKRVRDQFTRR